MDRKKRQVTIPYWEIRLLIANRKRWIAYAEALESFDGRRD